MDSIRKLQAAQLQAEESISVGTDILVNLQGQKEQLVRCRDNLDVANNNIDTASITLKKMSYKWYDPRYWLK